MIQGPLFAFGNNNFKMFVIMYAMNILAIVNQIKSSNHDAVVTLSLAVVSLQFECITKRSTGESCC